MMKRKYLITLSLFLLLFLASFMDFNDENDNAVVVLELFTSQGCSSCPSADALLGETIETYNNKHVFALSYHVDYWNYIGWKDPFSKKGFTEKQRAYARKFGDQSIYTPAVVINGQEHFVGSNRMKMRSKIKQYQKLPTHYSISLKKLHKTAEKIDFQYTTKGVDLPANASVVLAIKERTTKIKHGENAHRTLTNHHIVVQEKQLKNVEKSGNVTIKIPDIVTKNDQLIVFLLLKNQQEDILSAAQLHW